MAMKIAVAAVGTRGDVQPLLGLAAAVKEGLCNGDGDTVTLITHAAHQVGVAEPNSISAAAPPALLAVVRFFW